MVCRARCDGRGVMRTVSRNKVWTGSNMLFLVALDNDRMATLVTAVKQLRIGMVTDYCGHEVALKLFLQRCEEILDRARIRYTAGAAVGMDDEELWATHALPSFESTALNLAPRHTPPHVNNMLEAPCRGQAQRTG